MPTVRRSGIPYVIPLFLAFTVLLCVVAWLLIGLPLGGERSVSVSAEEGTPAEHPPIACVVIDAGHGGEDGGAVGVNGVLEKGLNLSVSFALRDLLEAAGVPVVMTRTEDKLLYDRNVDFQGRKKVLDLEARRVIAEEVAAEWEGNCLFVSIHMNAFPLPQYSGMQVWYGAGDPRSAEIAEALQSASVRLMPENRRRIKEAGSNIYLLDRIRTPAVLVECGFLSNPDEAAKLAEESYRYALASVIYGALAPYVGVTE